MTTPTPTPRGWDVLRNALSAEKDPGAFTDHELLYVLVGYVRKLYGLAVFVILVNIAAAIVLFLAIQSLEGDSGF